MKRMRFLLVLTTMLLSSRFVLAQVSLDLNGDYSTDPLDFAAVADAILAGEQSGSADINQDKKVDVKDITTMYNRIYNTRYFWFGNPRPYASDYTTKSGLAINKYNSISEVLAAAPTIKLDANQNGFILVPSGWDVSDVAMQDTGTGEYFALTERSTNIVNHKVYYSGKFSTAGNVTLKKKSDAEAFYKEKHPNNNPDNNPDNNNGVTYYDNITNCSANDASFATNDGASNGITFRLINKTGKYICFSGKYKLYIKQGDYNNWTSNASAEQELETHICPYDSDAGGYSHWYENPYKLAPDQALEFTLTEIKIYEHDPATGGVRTVKLPLDYYTNGSWHFMSVDKGNSIPAVKLGHGTKDKHNSAWLVRVRPIKSSDCLVQKGKKYNMIIYSADTSSPDWNCK